MLVKITAEFIVTGDVLVGADERGAFPCRSVENYLFFFVDVNAAVDKLFYNGSESKSIGITGLEKEDVLNVIITIWIEGWQELDGDAIWNEVDYIGSKFNVGIQFAVQDAFAE